MSSLVLCSLAPSTCFLTHVWGIKFHTIMKHVNLESSTQGRLVRLSYGRTGARIIMWLLRRSSRAFCAAQWLNHLSLAYITGLNFLIYVCNPPDVHWEITKPGVARLKFLISVFSGWDKRQKLMPCKYVILFLFVSILKLQLLKLNHSKIWPWKQLGKNGDQNSSLWILRKVNKYTKSSLNPHAADNPLPLSSHQ
jgi:hypothetical protein